MSLCMPWWHMEYSPKDRCMWSILPANHFTPGRSSQYPLNRRLVEPHGWCWHFGKRKSPPRGMDLTMIPQLSTLWPVHHTVQGIKCSLPGLPYTHHKKRDIYHLLTIKREHLLFSSKTLKQTKNNIHRIVIFQVWKQAHFSVSPVFCRRAETPWEKKKLQYVFLTLHGNKQIPLHESTDNLFLSFFHLLCIREKTLSTFPLFAGIAKQMYRL